MLHRERNGWLKHIQDNNVIHVNQEYSYCSQSLISHYDILSRSKESSHYSQSERFAVN